MEASCIAIKARIHRPRFKTQSLSSTNLFTSGPSVINPHFSSSTRRDAITQIMMHHTKQFCFEILHPERRPVCFEATNDDEKYGVDYLCCATIILVGCCRVDQSDHHVCARPHQRAGDCSPVLQYARVIKFRTNAAFKPFILPSGSLTGHFQA